jgi:predicted  nucleic acid-binding Zn-ribbon protein
MLINLKYFYKDAKNGLTDLETAVNSLDNMQINHNNKIQELEEKLKTARQKSDSLLQMSNEWERRINSSQAGLAAFEIATVYDSIATTLNTAYTKSKEVLENYEKANERLTKYLSEFESLKARSDEYSKKLGDLENEQEKSEKTLLDLVRRHNELDQRLSILNKEVENIESWVNKTQKNENILNEIEKSLIQQENELKQSSLKSKELQATIQTIELLKNNDKSDLETISNAKKMNDSINKLKEFNDKISGRVTQMSINYRSLDDKLGEINNEINALKILIESTRNIANEIKVAVKFRNSSYIKLRSAPVFMPSMSTIGSLYLNTTDANVPISVIYNRNDPNAYLALYLKDGAAHMQYRLSENAKVNIIKTSQAINNGQWYKLEVERIGRLGRLKVYNSRGNTITSSQSESDDQNVIFNIDSINANFYLGQFKFPGEMPKGLLALTNDGFFKNQFEGGIDTVTMNRHSFGLWNHDDSKEIEGEIKRSRAETESSLINSKLPVHSNKKSFLCTNKTISLALRRIKRFDVTLKFKSTNPNGILWYGRDDRDKIKINIYLENGHVAVKLTSIRENNKNIILDSNNNDRWNSERKLTDNVYRVIKVLISFEVAKSVAISIFEKEIPDNVNGELELGSITRPLEAKSFGATHICVGGIPESYAEPNDAKVSFVGCFEYYFSRNIDNERIYLQQELLKVSTTSSRVDTKCPDVLDQCLFNQNPDPVYVSFSEGIDSIEDLASFGISFIPRFSNGTLLFIRQKETQDVEAVNYIYLYLENLHVNLVVKNTKHILKLKSKLNVKYNDLNHVFVLKNDRDFTLNTNDVLEKEQLPEKIRIFTNSELFVGGVPKSLRIGINDKFNNFQGCVVDIFYKNKPLKFQLASGKSNELSFSRCYTPSFESISLGNSEKPLVKLFAEKSNKKTSLKDESCSLNKEYDQSVTKPVGIRFGLTRYSHMEVLDDNKLNKIISLKFRTVLNEGLIFYASDLRFEKYIAIWLKDGYLNYAFDTGSSFTHIVSKKQYNDGRYHTLIATRSSLEGTLRILDKTNTTVLEILQERSSGNDELLNFIGPYYIGGLSEAIFNRIPDSQKNIISIEAFVGCMSEFVIGAKKLELLKNRVKKIETMNCSNTHESGIFFTGTSQATYASFKSQISMKDAFELELDVKSRTKNGIILYIGPEDYKSNKDFATLELVNGELIYQIYFGGIINSIKYTPKETNNELCNSNWIRIKIKKSSNGKILLNIKNEEFISNKGDLLPSSAKNNVLYLGGLPNLDLYMKTTSTKEPFVGCIRDLIINQSIMKNHKILLDLKLEDGVLNYCPLK